jgi:hypothetical protein
MTAFFIAEALDTQVITFDQICVETVRTEEHEKALLALLEPHNAKVVCNLASTTEMSLEWTRFLAHLQAKADAKPACQFALLGVKDPRKAQFKKYGIASIFKYISNLDGFGAPKAFDPFEL